MRTLTPVRESVEKRASLPDVRDVFLCHAWDDRGGAAQDLHDLLESRGVHGKVIAKLVPEHPANPIEEVRRKLAGSLKLYKNPLGPAIPEEEIEAFK